MAIPASSTPAEVISNLANNVIRELPNAKPKERRTMIGAATTSIGYGLFDLYGAFQWSVDQTFPQTAEIEHLQRWGNTKKVFQLAPTGSAGKALATGVLGSVILQNHIYTYTDVAFKVVSSVSIMAVLLPCSIVVSSGVAHVTTTSDHNLNNGVKPVIDGSTTAGVDGKKEISVLSSVEFSYITTAIDGTATGIITVSYEGALVDLVTDTTVDDNTGVKTNASFGSGISAGVPLPGVDDPIVVNFDGITGGTETESVDDYRKRVISRWQNPVALFNPAAIKVKATEINGVTRVWVREITPDVGQVTVYFTRDNDENSIPSPTQRAIVKDSILTIKPVTTSDVDVILGPLTPITIDFTFSALEPNTLTMQAAITQSLETYFSTSTKESVNVDEDAYRAVIASSTSSTGENVVTFNLAIPSGDITVNDGELAVLGSVTY